MNQITFDPVEELVADIRAGKMVVVTDDENRENEGDLVLAAAHVTPEAIAFMVWLISVGMVVFWLLFWQFVLKRSYAKAEETSE